MVTSASAKGVGEVVSGTFVHALAKVSAKYAVYLGVGSCRIRLPSAAERELKHGALRGY
jgi:hypothetical protein